MDPLRIDEIARRLIERVPPALKAVREDLENNFRAVLRERLASSTSSPATSSMPSRGCSSVRARGWRRSRRSLAALEGAAAPERCDRAPRAPGHPAERPATRAEPRWHLPASPAGRSWD